MKRRSFLGKLSGLAAISMIHNRMPVGEAFADPGIVPKKIIIRGSWTTETYLGRLITPSIFRMVQRNIPAADMLFWPYLDDEMVMEKLRVSMPKMRVVTGNVVTSDGNSQGDILQELESADLLLSAGILLGGHDSTGHPAHLLNSLPELDFCRQKGILYGFHSLKLLEGWNEKPDLVRILNEAAFVYSSFPVDKKTLTGNGLTNKNAGFSPDALYFYDLAEESLAVRYLETAGIAGKEYLLLGIRKPGLDTGEKSADEYCGYIKSLIESWVTNTGNSVLIIPSQPQEAGFLREAFFNLFPENIKKSIAIREDINYPAEILSLVDGARICIANDPAITMMAINSRVPVIFTRNNSDEIANRYILPVAFNIPVVNLDISSKDDFINRMFDIQKNYVNSLLEVDGMMKNILQQEKSTFKNIDQLLVAHKKKKSSSKKR